MALVLLAAWAMRLTPALQSWLHSDEALYGYWGLLIGSGQDPWLERVPVYKPPLLPYLVAASQLLFGNAPFTIRMPGLAAGTVTVAATAALTRRLYGQGRAAILGALVAAMSPFGVLFSATAFPDALMVALGVAACLAAVSRRPAAAGLLAGSAVAAKQTGVIWLPLGLLLVMASDPAPRRGARRYLILYVASLGIALGWDAIRVSRGAHSFWAVGVAGYGGLRLVWPHELGTRLREWSRLARYLVGSWAANGLLVVGVPALLWSAVTRRRRTPLGLSEIALIGFGATYLMVHWLSAFPVWDRYLLPLMPIVAILLGRIGDRAYRFLAAVAPMALAKLPGVAAPLERGSWRSLALVIVGVLLVALLAPPGISAAQGRIPLGAGQGAVAGVVQITDYLRDLPEGCVVYHHWLGWLYRYYLFRGPIYLAYWPEPSWLTQDVRAFGASAPRYIAFPPGESSARVANALADQGYMLSTRVAAAAPSGASACTLYQVIPSGSS